MSATQTRVRPDQSMYNAYREAKAAGASEEVLCDLIAFAMALLVEHHGVKPKILGSMLP